MRAPRTPEGAEATGCPVGECPSARSQLLRDEAQLGYRTLIDDLGETPGAAFTAEGTALHLLLDVLPGVPVLAVGIAPAGRPKTGFDLPLDLHVGLLAEEDVPHHVVLVGEEGHPTTVAHVAHTHLDKGLGNLADVLGGLSGGVLRGHHAVGRTVLRIVGEPLHGNVHEGIDILVGFVGPAVEIVDLHDVFPFT